MEGVAVLFTILIVVGGFIGLLLAIIHVSETHDNSKPTSDFELYGIAKNDYDNIKEENNSYEKEINKIQSRIAELEKEKEKLSNEIESFIEGTPTTPSTEIDELQQLRQESRDLKDENQALKEQIGDLTAQVSMQAACAVDSEKYLEEIRNLKDENQILREQIEVTRESKTKHSGADAANPFMQKISELIQERNALKEKIENLEKELAESDHTFDEYELQRIRRTNRELKDENRALQEQIRSLTAQASMQAACAVDSEKYLEEIRELRADLADAEEQLERYTANGDFRKRYPAHYRTHDGHWVRSKIEREIANFFYDHKIRYEFEREYAVPNTRITYYPDFYLPDYKLFIEYFGKEDPEYVEKRETKKRYYEQDSRYRFEYVSFDDDYLLEEHLKELLRRHGVFY